MKNARLFALVCFITQALAIVSLAASHPKPKAHVTPTPAPVVISAEERTELLESIQADAHVAEAQDLAATADNAEEKRDLIDAHQDTLKAQAGEADAKAEATKLGNAAAAAEAGRKAAVARADAEAKSKRKWCIAFWLALAGSLVLVSLLGSQLQNLLDAIAEDALHVGEAVGGEAVKAVKKIGWVAKIAAFLAVL